MSSILDELKYKYPNEESVQKANNIAEGVAAMPAGGSGSAALIINVEESGITWTLDKTWQEIYDAHSAGTSCVILYTAELDSLTVNRSFSVTGVSEDNDSYSVTTYSYTFIASSESDYPSTSFD